MPPFGFIAICCYQNAQVRLRESSPHIWKSHGSLLLSKKQTTYDEFFNQLISNLSDHAILSPEPIVSRIGTSSESRHFNQIHLRARCQRT